MTYESEYFLVSLDDCKTYLGVDDVTEDNTIGYLMNVVSELFNSATRRTLIAEDLTEIYQGDGTGRLFLRSWPVNSTSETIEVYVDADFDFGADTKLGSDNIYLNTDLGYVVYINSSFEETEHVKVVYNAGYSQASVPYDLRGAALEALGILWKRHSEKRFDTTSYSRGDTSYTYLDEFPHTIRTVIERHTRY